MTIKIPKWALFVALVVLVAGVGTATYLVGRSNSTTNSGSRAPRTADQSKRLREWDARRGLDWATYKAQYKSGFYAACDRVFLEARAGVLSDSTGRDYTFDDCYARFAQVFDTTTPFHRPPRDPVKAGQMDGGLAGCTAMVVFTNQDLKGTKATGEPITLTLNSCYSEYQAYPGPYLGLPKVP